MVSASVMVILIDIESIVVSTAGLMVILIDCRSTAGLMVILFDSVVYWFDGGIDGDID